MSAIEPAIRTPGQAVYEIVPGLEGEAIEVDDRWAVRNIVAIFVWNEEQVGRRSNPDAAKAERNTAETMPFVEEDFSFIEPAISIFVGKNDNAIAISIFPVGIGEAFDDPKASAIIEIERDRLHHVGF